MPRGPGKCYGPSLCYCRQAVAVPFCQEVAAVPWPCGQTLKPRNSSMWCLLLPTLLRRRTSSRCSRSTGWPCCCRRVVSRCVHHTAVALFCCLLAKPPVQRSFTCLCSHPQSIVTCVSNYWPESCLTIVAISFQLPYDVIRTEARGYPASQREVSRTATAPALWLPDVC